MGLVLFDGICNLCDWSVRFIFRNDPKAHFRFAPLQSEAAQRELASLGITLSPGEDLGTIRLIENGRVYERSTAVLQIARRLRFPWPLLAVALLLPRAIRDPLYRWVARNRYRWFGQKESCDMPPLGLRERFIAWD